MLCLKLFVCHTEWISVIKQGRSSQHPSLRLSDTFILPAWEMRNRRLRHSRTWSMSLGPTTLPSPTWGPSCPLREGTVPRREPAPAPMRYRSVTPWWAHKYLASKQRWGGTTAPRTISWRRVGRHISKTLINNEQCSYNRHYHYRLTL